MVYNYIMNRYIFKAIVFVFMIVLISIGVSPLLLNVNKQNNSPNIATVNSASSASIVEVGEIKSFASTYYSSGVVINDGKYDHVYTWGSNWYGELGTGEEQKYTSSTPTEVFFDIDGIEGNDNVVIKDFYMDNWSSAVVINDGVNDHLYTWGREGRGSKNVPTESSLTSSGLDVVLINDLSFGNSNSSAITEDENGVESLYVWGANEYGELGIGDVGEVVVPVKLDIGQSVTGYKNVDMGGLFSAVVVTTNKGDELYTWGNNPSGQLGIGESTLGTIVWEPEIVDFNKNSSSTSLGEIKFMDLGAEHSSVVIANDFTGNDELYTWGDNRDGQLGLGDELDYSIPEKVNISGGNIIITDMVAGVWNTLFSTIENNQSHLYVTGWGNMGVIGNDSFDTTSKFMDITKFIPDFDKKSDEIYSIALGQHHAGIVVNDGKYNTIYTWGDNQYGQLGHPGPRTNVITELLSVELIKFLWLWITLGVIGIIVIIVIIVYLSKKLLSKSDLRKADKRQDRIKKMKVQEAIRSLQQ